MMKFAGITDRLANLGGAKWEVHIMAKTMMERGEDLLSLTIGEPDSPPPPELIAAAKAAIDAGRLGYCNGRGETALLAALADRYSRRTGRSIGTDQIIALPGTQTALFAVMTALVGPGDEVLVGDPMYATYEGIVAATGATIVPVPLRPENGFRMSAADVAARITPNTRVLFLNSPHNPTGSVLRAEDLRDLGRMAIDHDLWIVSDEVYEELVFDNVAFRSPFDLAELADRTVVCASISKSHAAPGFRSGWCVGSAAFSARLLPVVEMMLFGNQPFIADMTALAVSRPSTVARDMAQRFARRSELVWRLLDCKAGLRVNQPEAGMFSLVDIRSTGLSGNDFALGLLAQEKVAVMPGESFGPALAGWLRVSLTKDDALIAAACAHILTHAQRVIAGGQVS